MSWWEIALLVYFIPFPIPQIMTIAWIMVFVEDLKHKRRNRS